MQPIPSRLSWSALLLCLTLVLGSCYSAPDKRLIQHLNTQGFGQKYSGNAEEEDWVDIQDSVAYQDTWNPEVAAQERIGIDGTIIVPEVGAVHVAGLTRTEIEALLTQKLAPYYKRTDVRVKIQTAPKRYFIFGEVQNTGIRQHKGDLTIFEAVMGASPHPSKANLGRVRLIRPDPRDPLIFTVNIAEILRTGDTTFNIHVYEDDIIVVPPTLFAQLGYFLTDLITPFTEVFSSIFSGLLKVNQFNKFGNNKNNNLFNF